MASQRVHIIDGTGQIFRAFYGVRPLSTAAGEPTNAVYGFITMLEKLLREEQPTHLAIVFDAAGPNFRHELYPAYKENRDAPPEDLRPQFDRVREVAEAFRAAVFMVPGVEADDVIATLTGVARAAGHEVCIISGDKDLMQLVDGQVSLYEPMRGGRYGPAEVEEKWGVPPAQLRDALALAGDSSDNVPGVAGIGPKTAATLLQKYGDLDAVLAAAQAGEVKGKRGKTLAESGEVARLSRRLVSLKMDVPLPDMSWEGLRYEGPDKARLRELYLALEFRRLVPKLDVPVPVGSAPTSGVGVTIRHEAYRVIRSEAALTAYVDGIRGAEAVGVSVELGEGPLVDAPLLGISLCAAPGEAVYIPVGHSGEVAGDQLREQDVLQALGPLMAAPLPRKRTGDGKALIGLFKRAGMPFERVNFDCTLASYLLVPDDAQHGPAAVAARYLGHEAVQRNLLLRDGRKRLSFASQPPERVLAMMGEQAEVPLIAAAPLEKTLREAELYGLFKDVELPLQPVLVDMELAGMLVDVAQLKALSRRFEAEIARVEAACHEAAGRPFKVSSPKQLQEVLFQELKLKIKKTTKTGPSTDQEALEGIYEDHPLPRLVIEYRQLTKLKSTYTDQLPKLVRPGTGRVHTRLNQTTAATGRLSSTDPNLQNIPIRTELGQLLRAVFIAPEGRALVSVDYSQVELRVLAHLSEDRVLVSAFEDGVDVHRRTASVLFEVPEAEVSREQRTQAKAVNFGVLYGMGPTRLARELHIKRKLASGFIKDYFERQPGVRRYLEDTVTQARADGLVRTLLGRRRLLPDLHSNNRGSRTAAERVAVNTPIQGSAADLIKLAMVRVQGILSEQHPTARLLLQVHDELLVECAATEAEAVSALVKREMEQIYPLKVPLTAEASQGPTWAAAH